ncbi:hypothetical protein WJX84_002670 [Apatococcus fuscideae]|uniref:SET domain-containing protein n=1 Tax=Apatococcus fuscideae TaxID=2026836 RepID=A0AAW1SVL0_9CHLO
MWYQSALLHGGSRAWVPANGGAGGGYLTKPCKVVSIQLGIPVRLIRKNPDKDAMFGNVFVYDGLYNVVKFWLSIGLDGKQGLFCTDLSNGKENCKVVCSNVLDDEFPPGMHPSTFPKAENMRGKGYTNPAALDPVKIAAYDSKLEYLTDYRRRRDVPAPKQIKLQPGMQPHDLVAELNRGCLPYREVTRNNRSHWMLPGSQGVVYECGPWSGCQLGTECPYAMSQQGLKYRLEVFKTPKCGWAVRTWDLIPMGVFVTMFVGEIWPHKELMEENAADRREDTYFFDMGKRTDYDDAGKYIGYTGQDPNPTWTTDAMLCGSISRFINHSCDANLYVQPVIAGHSDVPMASIALFSSRVISPFDELCYDYGQSYILNKLERCLCGAASCISNRPAE